MKYVDYRKIKRNNNSSLQQYDLGKRNNVFSGYQQGDQIDTSQFSSTPTQSFNKFSDQIRSQIGPTIAAGATGLVNNALGIAGQLPWFQGATKAITSGVTNAISNTATQATNTATAAGVSTAGNAASKTAGAVMGALGPVMNIAGAVTGGIGIANAVSAFNDPVVTSSDMLNSMGKSTQSKYGELYTTYTGLDRGSIEDVIDGANSRDKANLQMSGASTGMSVGALGGSIFGPLGTAIGAGIGGLFGWLGGLFGGESAAEKRRKRIERAMDNVEYTTTNYNTNEEAEAASKGIRRIFSENHIDAADKGKDVHTNFGKPGKMKMVHTTSGIKPGIELGVAGGKESIVDFKENTASVIEEGKKRVDNISVGIPLDSNSTKQDWDNDVFIAGNIENPYTGNTIAEDAEPYAKNVEKINKQNPMTSLGKKTKEINLRNQMEQLRWLSDVQSAVKQAESYYANCGKMPKHNIGKILSGIGEYAMALLPHIAQTGYLTSDNTDYTPRSYNPFVASNYGKYVDSMRKRKLNPSQALKNAEKAALQNRYATTHQGGLSAGQIAALTNISNLATANAKNNILADYAQKNIALANEADRLGIQASMSEAARQQQANANWYEWLMRSGSAANNLKQANRKAMYDQFGAIGSDLLSMFQYNQARALQNKKIDLFDKAMDLGFLS